MTAIVSILLEYFLGSSKANSNRDQKLKLHYKCRNSDPNNDKFYYQSNMDSVKGKLVLVRL